MKNTFLPFFIFLVLLISMFPIGDFAVSVVPGWHTPIFTYQQVFALLVTGCLILTVAGYFLAGRWTERLNLPFFLLHLALTLPVIILLRIPFFYNFMEGPQDMYEVAGNFILLTKLSIVIAILFLTGELVFIIYFIKILVQKIRRQRTI